MLISETILVRKCVNWERRGNFNCNQYCITVNLLNCSFNDLHWNDIYTSSNNMITWLVSQGQRFYQSIPCSVLIHMTTLPTF